MTDPAEGAEEQVWRSIARWSSENPAQALSLLAVATYAALWVPTYIFYEHLGVTPDEVGLDLATLIRASLSVILFALGVGAFIAAAGIWLEQLQMQRGVIAELRPSHPGAWRIRAWYAVTSIPPLAIVVALALNASVTAVVLIVLAAAIVLGSVPRALLARWQPTVWGAHERHARGRMRNLRARAALFGLLYFAIPLVFVGLTASAFDSVNTVHAGGAVDYWLWPWRAVPARVLWASPATTALPDCRELRYLGTGSGLIVLYDVRSRVVYRVPSASVTLLTGSRAC